MNSSITKKSGAIAFLGLIIALFIIVNSASAVPAAFDWGSANTDALPANGFGIVDADGATYLVPGDVAQLIYVGPNGVIDLPYADGSAGGDDVILDRTTVDDANYPPPFRGFGFIPAKLFNYDTEDPIEGGTVYMRVWNDSAITEDSCFGNSETTTLSNLTSFNSPSFATDSCSTTLAVSVSHQVASNSIDQTAIQFAAILALATMLLVGYYKVNSHSKPVRIES